MIMKRSDKQLIADYLEGDEKSLEVLIKRYLGLVYGFVLRYINDRDEAEDITQEVFIKAWRNLKKFKQNKNFRAWIFTIAKNSRIDYLRKARRTIPFSEFDRKQEKNLFAETIADATPLQDKLIEKAEIAKTLSSALQKLSPKYRQVLLVRYNNGFTFKKIALALDESINTVKTRHRRGLAILKKLLKEKNEPLTFLKSER